MSGGRGRSCGSWNIKNLTNTLRIGLNFRGKFDLLSKLAIKFETLSCFDWVYSEYKRQYQEKLSKLQSSGVRCICSGLFHWFDLKSPNAVSESYYTPMNIIVKCSQRVWLYTDEHYVIKKSLQFEPRQIDWCFQSLFKVLSAIIDLVTHKYK